MGAFEDFVNLELPQRLVYLDISNTGYDGDPNDGGAPSKVANAPNGTLYRELTAQKHWRKIEGGVWEEQGTGGGNADLGIVGRVTVTWYVRNAGDDNNDGLTPGTAFATLQKALSMLAPNAEGLARQVINTTGFTGTGADVFYWDFPSAGNRDEFDGTRDTSNAKQDYWNYPFEIIADPTHVRDITIVSSTQDPVTDIAQVTVSDTLVVDELKGKRIWVGLFFQGTVLSNTANDIILASYSGSAFPNGVTGVYEPSCTLDFGDGALAFSGARFKCNSPVAFTGIKFDTTLSGAGVAMECEADGGLCTFTWCDFIGGWTTGANSDTVFFFDCYCLGGGWYPNSPYGISGCVFEGMAHGISGSVGAGANSISGSLFDGCQGIAGGNFEQNTDLVITNCWITNGTQSGINKNHPFNGRFNSNRIDNCAASGISVTTGGGVQKIRDTVGSGNGHYGVRIHNGAIVQYQHTIGLNTVVGALGEVLIGERNLLWTDCPNHDFDSQFTQHCSVISGPNPKQSRARFEYIYAVNSGESGPVVWDDWEDLWRQLEYTRSLNGDAQFTVAIDASANPFPAFSDVPASIEFPVYDFRNVRLTGVPGQLPELRFLDGAHVVNLRHIDSIGVYDANLTTPLEALPGDVDFPVVLIENNASIQSIDGGAGFFDASNVALAGMRLQVTELSVLAWDIPGHGYKQGQLVVNAPAGFFLQLVGYDLNPVQRNFSDHTRATFDMAPGSFALLFAEDAAGLPSGLGTAFQGTLLAPLITEAASLVPNPFQALPSAASVGAAFKQMLRLDASAGPISQALPSIFNEELPNSGGMLAVVEYGGGEVTLTVPSGNSINGGTKGAGVLTLAANAGDGEQVTLGSQTYTFNTVLGGADSVLIGASASDSIDNLIAAINGGAGEGSLYGTGTIKNALASAAAGAGDTMDAIALLGGVITIATTETLLAGGSQWAAATLQGGDGGTLIVPPGGGVILESDGVNDWRGVGIFNPNAGPNTSYTFKEGGGGIGPTEFEDFHVLMAAMDANRIIAGGDFQSTLLIDSTIVNPSIMPAPLGAPYNLDGVRMDGTDSGFGTRLDLAEGVKFTGLRRFGNNLGLRSLSSQVCESPSGNTLFQVGFNTFLNSAGGGAIWDDANMAGEFFQVLLESFASINFNFGGGSGTDPVFLCATANANGVLMVPAPGAFLPITGIDATDASALYLVRAPDGQRLPEESSITDDWAGVVSWPTNYDINPSLIPTPLWGAPFTAAQTGGFDAGAGKWMRFDVSGGPISQELMGISDAPFGNRYTRPGVFLIISEESGTVGLELTPKAGDTINGSTDAFPVPAGGSVQLLPDGVSNWKVQGIFDPNALASASSALVYREGSAENGPIVFGTWQGVQDRLAVLRASSQNAGVFEVLCDASVTDPCTIPMRANTAPVAPTAALTGPAVGAMGALADKMTLTDAGASFDASYVGRYIFNASWTTPANDGWKLITSVISPTVIEYLDASGVAEAVGAGTYEVSQPWDMTNTRLGSVGATTIEIAPNTTFKKLRQFKGNGFLTCNTPAGGPSMITDFGPEPFDAIDVEDGFAMNGIGGGAPSLVETYTGGPAYFCIVNLRNRANISQNPGGGSVVFRSGLAGQTLVVYALSVSSVWRSGIQVELGAVLFAALEQGCVWGSMNSTQSSSPGTESIFVMNIGPMQNVDPPADAPAHTAAFNMFAHQFNIVRFDVSAGGFSQSLPQLPQDNGSTGKGSRVTIKEESGSPGLVIVPHVGTPFESPPIPDTIEGGIKSTGALGPNAVPTPGETVTIAGRVYTWVAAAPVLPDDLSIAATTGGLELDILVAAINGTGTPGVDYGVGTTVNTDVSAASAGAAGMTVEALLAGVGGDLITTTTSMAGPAWGAATLLGGDNGSYDIPPGGTVIFVNDGLSNWLVEAVFDPNQSGARQVTYQPGGTDQRPGVFTDWDECVAQLALMRARFGKAEIDLVFDDSIVSPIVIPAGGEYDMTDVWWTGVTTESLFNNVEVEIPEGATFTGLRYFKGHLTVTNKATATVPDTSLADGENIFIQGRCTLESAAPAAVPLWNTSSLIASDAVLVSVLERGAIGFNSPLAHPIIENTVAGVTLIVGGWQNAIIRSDSLGAVAGAIVNMAAVGSGAQVNLPQVDVTTLGTLIQSVLDYPQYSIGSIVSATPHALSRFTLLNRYDTTAANIVADLPPADEIFAGIAFTIKNYAGGNNVNTTPDGTDTIDGVAALSAVTPGSSAQFVSDGVSDWTRL